MAYQDVNLGTALNDKQSIEFIKDLWDMEQPVSPIELVLASLLCKARGKYARYRTFS